MFHFRRKWVYGLLIIHCFDINKAHIKSMQLLVLSSPTNRATSNSRIQQSLRSFESVCIKAHIRSNAGPSASFPAQRFAKAMIPFDSLDRWKQSQFQGNSLHENQTSLFWRKSWGVVSSHVISSIFCPCLSCGGWWWGWGWWSPSQASSC